MGRAVKLIMVEDGLASNALHIADLATNASSQDVRVNFLQHFEYDNEHDNKRGQSD